MEQNGKKKKRHIGLKIFLTLLLLLLAAAAGLVIYFYPAYRAAGYLSKNLSFQKMEYVMEVRLDREELDTKKRILIDTMAEITGITGEELCHLTIQGSIDGDVIYACIYPEGQEKPLTELYLSDDLDVVNGAMLYSAMRENFCGQNAMLNYLFPVWEEHKYMSLKQAEDMFGVDLSAFRNFQLPFRDRKLSRMEYFVILAVMHRDKAAGGESFSYRKDGIDVAIWPREQIECSVSIEDPADILDELSRKLSKVGINLSGNKLRILDSLSLTAEMKGDVALQMPKDLVSQNMVDIVKGIRAVIRELSGK